MVQFSRPDREEWKVAGDSTGEIRRHPPDLGREQDTLFVVLLESLRQVQTVRVTKSS